VWAFVISAVFSFAAFFIAAVVAEAVAGRHFLVLEENLLTKTVSQASNPSADRLAIGI